MNVSVSSKPGAFELEEDSGVRPEIISDKSVTNDMPWAVENQSEQKKLSKNNVFSSSLYSCLICDFTCDNEETFDGHRTKRKVIITPAETPYRDTSSSDTVEVISDSGTEETRRGNDCPFCNLTSKDLKCLKAHIENIHMNFKVSTPPDDAIEILSKEVVYSCEECHFIGNAEQFGIHKMSHINALTPSVIITDEAPLNLDKNSVNEPFPCENCDAVFQTFPLLQEHVATCHSSQSITCNYCPLTFFRRSKFTERTCT